MKALEQLWPFYKNEDLEKHPILIIHGVLCCRVLPTGELQPPI
jgi:hypothetical protein